jgi:hypothetical protein
MARLARQAATGLEADFDLSNALIVSMVTQVLNKRPFFCDGAATQRCQRRMRVWNLMEGFIMRSGRVIGCKWKWLGCGELRMKGFDEGRGGGTKATREQKDSC